MSVVSYLTHARPDAMVGKGYVLESVHKLRNEDKEQKPFRLRECAVTCPTHTRPEVMARKG